MATIERRARENGRASYRAKVRRYGRSPLIRTFRRRKEALNWAERIERKIETDGYNTGEEAEKRTLGEAIERYLEEECVPETTGYHRERLHLTWFKERIGRYALVKVTPAVISDLKREFKKRRLKNGKKISGATLNRYLCSLSAVFRMATTEWLWCMDNPVRKVRKEKENPGIVRFLSDDERDTLLSVCKDDPCKNIYLVVVLAISTGARRSELWNLCWKEVNLKEGAILLEKTKNGERRRLPVRELALELLKKHAKVRRLDSDYVFPGPETHRTGRPFSLDDAWKRVIKESKIENFRFHDLRHTCASYLAMNGASILEIAEILGHKTLQMVKRYSHLAEGHTASVVDDMNRKIFGS